MRVLHVLLGSRFDGNYASVAAVAAEMGAHGVELVVLTPPLSSEAKRQLMEDIPDLNLTVCEFDTPKKVRNLGTLVRAVAWLFGLVPQVVRVSRVITRIEPDLVHVHGLLGLQVAAAARLSHRRLIWQLISVGYPRWIVQLLAPLVAALAHRIVVLTPRMAEFYRPLLFRALFMRKVAVAGESVRPRYFSAAQRSRGPDSRMMTVAGAGALTEQKGFEYLIEAASHLRAEPIQFLIAGGVLKGHEDYAHQLEDVCVRFRLERSVNFLGQQPDIMPLLASADVFVLSSVEEGVPIVMLEAMAAGLPIIATAVGGIPDVIRNGLTGILVPPRDSMSLARAILRLRREPDLRAELGRRAREAALAEHSPKASCERLLEVYAEGIRASAR